jgi:hypothetical protein
MEGTMTTKPHDHGICNCCGGFFKNEDDAVEHYHTHPPYDLNYYEEAFVLLGQGDNYKTQVPDFIRQAMVFVALNLDYKENANKEALQNLFGSTSGLRWNDIAIVMCLNMIVNLKNTGNPKTRRTSAG